MDDPDTNRQLRWVPNTEPGHLTDLQALLQRSTSKLDGMSNSTWHFYRKLLNDHDFPRKLLSDHDFPRGKVAVNRACCKLWEILGMFSDSIPYEKGMRTLHLAEAPGSFVQALGHKLTKMGLTDDWVSLAVSRPPSSYAEVLKKSKQVPKFHSAFDRPFLYLDLERPESITHLTDSFGRMSQGLSAQVITEDGGFDEESQYHAKETLHYRLILAKVIAILLNQSVGGWCCIKVFDLFTETTISILYLLCKHYRGYHFFKPLTSRPTNAEKYVICNGFLGPSLAPRELLGLLSSSDVDAYQVPSLQVPCSFRDEILLSSRSCAEAQIHHIERIHQFMTETKGLYIDKAGFDASKQNAYLEWKTVFGSP
ncbi:hypothetical protein HDV00_012389 [Rhizophlyctis rosea]|nr:hypothetical protein HDV00_012389 [Rhizophlyctis rosea]